MVVPFFIVTCSIAMNSPESCDSGGVQLGARARGTVQNRLKSSRKERSGSNSEFRVFTVQCGRKMSETVWGCRSGSTTS